MFAKPAPIHLQLANFGAPAEFQAAIDHQRARIAAAAKDLGIVPTQ
jgi:hypothetical protein